MKKYTYFNTGKRKTTTLPLLLKKIKMEPNIPDSSSIGYYDIKTGGLGQYLLTTNQPDMLLNHSKMLIQSMSDFPIDPTVETNGTG